MQERLVLVQKNHVVGIPEIIFDTDLLFYPMVKVCEVRADVRMRIRGGVIRIRIAEACIRTVIRITAEQDTTKNDQPFLSYVITIYY